MAMVIDTLGPEGPWCPMCHKAVDKEGQFDGPFCWSDFHLTIHDLGVTLIDIQYIELEDQPWYGKHT